LAGLEGGASRGELHPPGSLRYASFGSLRCARRQSSADAWRRVEGRCSDTQEWSGRVVDVSAIERVAPRAGAVATTHPVYLDYNATAPLRPEAAEAMLAAFRSVGNAASAHVFGRQAADQVEHARLQVAQMIGASPGEVIFTSGATEANNLALHAATPAEGLLVVSAAEHPAVLDTAKAQSGSSGLSLITIGVDQDGLLSMEQLRKVLEQRQPTLVSVMAANNETGVLTDLQHVARMTQAHGALLHTDATQLVGRMPVDLSTIPVDLLSMSAHKFGGPQGVGALFIRRQLRLAQRPLLHGGGQERGWRAGTTNVAGVVGMGAAAAAAGHNMSEEQKRTRELRDRLEHELMARLPQVRRNGHVSQRLPGVTSLTFAGTPADAVLAAMPNVAASDGSACASGALAPSHVLLAMGRTAEQADSTLRFSLGYATTDDDVSEAVASVSAAVGRVRVAMNAA
jgi:cysteine desulfurase